MSERLFQFEFTTYVGDLLFTFIAAFTIILNHTRPIFLAVNQSMFIIVHLNTDVSETWTSAGG